MILKLFIKLTNKKLILPFYHYVDNKVFDFTKSLYHSKNILDFKNDLDLFLKYYKSISLEELINLKKNGFKPKKPCFHLTFDDGLSNFYHIIAPILIERKIFATVFLNTDFIDNKELFYRYKASLLINNFTKSDDDIQIKYFQFIYNYYKKEKNYLTSKKLLIADVISFLLNIKFHNKGLLDQLAKKINYSFKDFLEKEKPYLSLSQIKNLQKQGFTFGVHSKNHPYYAEISLEEQLNQTNESLQWLTNNLNLKFNTFSFPFSDINVSDLFFNKIESSLDLSFGTSGIKKSKFPFQLQRIDMEKNKNNTKLFLLKIYLKSFFNFVK